MTWLQIYNMTRRLVWGEEAPPEGTVELLQGQFGIIGNIHRNIQQWRNYWFMEAATTIAVVAGTVSYDLPTDFKGMFTNGLRFIDSNGYYLEPLKCMYPGDYKCFKDDTAVDYPEYYEVYGGHIVFPQMTNSNQTLHCRYYKYLSRPPETFDATSDALTINGCAAIYYLAAAEAMRGIEEISKCREYETKGQQALDILNEADMSLRRSDQEQIRYSGI